MLSRTLSKEHALLLFGPPGTGKTLTLVEGILAALWYDACCSVLQSAAVCCSVLQCVALCCSVCSVLIFGPPGTGKTLILDEGILAALRYDGQLQPVAVCCSLLQSVAALSFH